MISLKELIDLVEAKWKHVAYDPRTDKIYLLGDRYRCLDTKADWFDFEDGRKEKRALNNSRRIRAAKTRHWIYLGTRGPND